MLLFAAFTPARASELPVTVGDTGIEIGDRLRIRAKIMRVDQGNQTLLVSEKEVRLLEHYPEAPNLKTRLLDEEGKPAAFGSFKQGETVLVLGYSDSAGHVYAMKIQRVDPAAPAPEPSVRQASQFQRAGSQKSIDPKRRQPARADRP
jgi:hypothetical protein